MSASLDACSKALTDDDRKLLRRCFPDQRKFDFMKRKGEYPYDDVQDHNYINRTSLPPIGSFYSILKRKDISHKKYHKALTLFGTNLNVELLVSIVICTVCKM